MFLYKRCSCEFVGGAVKKITARLGCSEDCIHEIDRYLRGYFERLSKGCAGFVINSDGLMIFDIDGSPLNIFLGAQEHGIDSKSIGALIDAQKQRGLVANCRLQKLTGDSDSHELVFHCINLLVPM